MSDTDQGMHLSRIDTVWSMVLDAHHATDERQVEAMERLLRRYGKAIHRYLLAVVGNADDAADLAQELALRLVRGDFQAARPERGRFRQMIKSAALNLVVDYHRRRRLRPGQLAESNPEVADPANTAEDWDREFVASWRSRLLGLAASSLERYQQRTGRPFYDVFRLRKENPELSSAQLAELMSQQQGRPIKSNWVRQMLLRARERYASALLAEIWRSLEHPSPENLEEELIELGLLKYCQKHLARFGFGG